jgi:hypothetical protein
VQPTETARRLPIPGRRGSGRAEGKKQKEKEARSQKTEDRALTCLPRIGVAFFVTRFDHIVSLDEAANDLNPDF